MYIKILGMIFKGISINILTTIIASIFPILAGCLLTYVSKNNNAMIKPIKIIGNVFESFSPIIMMTLIAYISYHTKLAYYATIFSLNTMCYIGLSLAFVGYIPSRINNDNSFQKDMVVNSLGLLANAFKWSFCIGLVANVRELYVSVIHQALIQGGRRPEMLFAVLISVLFSFIILFVLKMLRLLLEEKMN